MISSLMPRSLAGICRPSPIYPRRRTPPSCSPCQSTYSTTSSSPKRRSSEGSARGGRRRRVASTHLDDDDRDDATTTATTTTWAQEEHEKGKRAEGVEHLATCLRTPHTPRGKRQRRPSNIFNYGFEAIKAPADVINKKRNNYFLRSRIFKGKSLFTTEEFKLITYPLLQRFKYMFTCCHSK